MKSTFESLGEQFYNLYKGFIEGLPEISIAILVMILFIFIAKMVKRTIKNVLERVKQESAITQLVTSVAYVFIIIIGMIVALEVLNLSNTVNKLLAGAGIVGLGVSFAFQDILANVFAGIIIAFRKPFDIGDMIEINGVFGQVEFIRLRSIYIHNYKGQTLIIPSRNVLQNNIINFTNKGIRRVDVNVGVAFDSDLELVKKITLQTMQALPFVMHDRLIDFYFVAFADSSINLSVRFWIDLKDCPDFMFAQSEAIISLKKSFDENNINIPFPIRTLNFPEKEELNRFNKTT